MPDQTQLELFEYALAEDGGQEEEGGSEALDGQDSVGEEDEEEEQEKDEAEAESAAQDGESKGERKRERKMQSKKKRREEALRFCSLDVRPFVFLVFFSPLVSSNPSPRRELANLSSSSSLPHPNVLSPFPSPFPHKTPTNRPPPASL